MADGTEVIPSVSVPLNQTDCMCESLTSVASSVAESFTIANTDIKTSCFVNQQCSGIDCPVMISIFTFHIEVDVQPCETPPGIFLVVRNAGLQAIYEGYFISDDVISVVSEDNIDIQVNVKIEQRDYSMNVEVRFKNLT